MTRSVPTLAEGWLVESFEEGSALYHPGAERVVDLNATATLVLRLCDGERDVAAIAELLTEAYPDDGVAADVARVVSELVSAGVLVVA